MLRLIPIYILVLCLAGCSSQGERDPVLGEAHVGPATLQIRKELTAGADVAATVKHGEQVDIIGKRRRFYKVRTSSGAEGWLDGRMLLSTEDMEDLRDIADRSSKAPSQGKATVFDPLNVHTVANRQSPSFFQVTPGMHIDVIAHERSPRVPFQSHEFVKAPLKPEPPRKPKKMSEAKIPPPPAGPAPALPENWLELSGRGGDPEPDSGVLAEAQTKEAEEKKPVHPMDEWALIRTQDGRAGWVLSRNLLMSIPDEVAQYAERARIAAYFQLGSVSDQGKERPVWLWAALSERGAAHDFDSLRIFTWSVKRHRYETSFIERGVKGHLPITLDKGAGGAVNGFKVVVEEKTGAVVERDYSLQGYRARITGRKECALPPGWLPEKKEEQAPAEVKEAPALSWKDRAKGWMEAVKAKIKR